MKNKSFGLFLVFLFSCGSLVPHSLAMQKNNQIISSVNNSNNGLIRDFDFEECKKLINNSTEYWLRYGLETFHNRIIEMIKENWDQNLKKMFIAGRLTDPRQDYEFGINYSPRLIRRCIYLMGFDGTQISFDKALSNCNELIKEVSQKTRWFEEGRFAGNVEYDVEAVVFCVIYSQRLGLNYVCQEKKIDFCKCRAMLSKNDMLYVYTDTDIGTKPKSCSVDSIGFIYGFDFEKCKNMITNSERDQLMRVRDIRYLGFYMTEPNDPSTMSSLFDKDELTSTKISKYSDHMPRIVRLCLYLMGFNGTEESYNTALSNYKKLSQLLDEKGSFPFRWRHIRSVEEDIILSVIYLQRSGVDSLL